MNFSEALAEKRAFLRVSKISMSFVNGDVYLMEWPSPRVLTAWTIETARTILWNQPIEFISIAATPAYPIVQYGGRRNLEKEAAILENEKTLETRLVFPYAFDRLERRPENLLRTSER